MTSKILVVMAAAIVMVLIIGGVIVLNRTSNDSSEPGGSTPAASSASGKLESADEVVGTGSEAKVGSSITVKYKGTLADGTVFDSTEKQGGDPVTFTLAQGSLIDGWVQGIPGMKVGGKRKLVIPPELAYGAQGQGSIPPNATLTFEIELVDVK